MYRKWVYVNGGLTAGSLFQKPYPSFQVLVPFSGIPQTSIFYKPAFSVIALAHDIPAPLFHLMSPRSALSRAALARHVHASRSRRPSPINHPSSPSPLHHLSTCSSARSRSATLAMMGIAPLNRQAAKKHTEVASSTSRRIIPMKRANVLPQLHMLFNLTWPPSPKHLPCFLRHLTHKR